MNGSAAQGAWIDLDFTTGGHLPPDLLRRLDAIAERERPAFNDLIGSLSQGRERNIDWWVSRPASRNVHVSPLFKQCVQLALARELAAEGARLRIRVDSPALAAVIAAGAGQNVEVARHRPVRARLRRLQNHLCNLGSCFFHGLSAMMAARLTRHLARSPPRDRLVLVDCFVTRESFAGGSFRDRYFPGLVAALSEEGRRRIWFVPVFYRVRGYLQSFRALRRDATNFLVREDHLRIGDYFFAAGHWWRVRRLLGHRARFAGFEIGTLVDADLRAGCFARSAFLALLSYRFLLRAKGDGLLLDRYINWYEGHDVDHAAAAAVNWNGLDIRLVAYRPVASRFNLSPTPAAHEVAAGVVPATFAVVGRAFERELAAAHPKLNVVAAPGLRHSGLGQCGPPGRRRNGAVLVILPLQADLIRGIRELMADAVDSRTGEIRWLIKRHPQMPRSEAEALFGAPSFTHVFVEGDFHTWLREADAVAGMATSSLVEAIGAGVPAICLANGNEPTEIPIPAWVDQRLWRLCYSPQDLVMAIEDGLDAGIASIDLARLSDDLLSPGGAERMRDLHGLP